jgi:hypothetical protein
MKQEKESTEFAAQAESPQIDRPTRTIAALLGFLQKAEVDAIFKQQPFETIDAADPLVLWRELDEYRQHLLLPTSAEIKELPAALATAVTAVKARKTYKIHYEAVGDYSFVLAPIESLLSPQWYADLDYIDELCGRLGADPSLEEQFAFCMAEGRITQPIVVNNQVWFTSKRRDLFADRVPKVREVEGGEIEIVVRAASRPNYVQAAKVGEKLVLTNGVHKVCALHKLGQQFCPALLRTVNSFEELGLAP